MQPFVDVFNYIDKDGSGEISIEELKEYQVERNLKEAFVTKWQNLFDKNHTGVITYAHFCDVLGIKPARRKSSEDDIEEEFIEEEEIQNVHTVPVFNAPDKNFRDFKVVQSKNISDAECSLISDRLNMTYDKNQDSPCFTSFLISLDRDFGRRWLLKVVDGEKQEMPQTASDKYLISENGYGKKVLIWRHKETRFRNGCLFCC